MGSYEAQIQTKFFVRGKDFVGLVSGPDVFGCHLSECTLFSVKGP